MVKHVFKQLQRFIAGKPAVHPDLQLKAWRLAVDIALEKYKQAVLNYESVFNTVQDEVIVEYAYSEMKMAEIAYTARLKRYSVRLEELKNNNMEVDIYANRRYTY